MTRLTSRPQTATTTDRTRVGPALMTACLYGLALPAQAATLRAAATSQGTGWNHPAHLVAVLLLGLVVGVAAWAMRQPDGPWARWHAGASPGQHAVAVLGGLLAIDVLLCLAFWTTRDSDPAAVGYLRAAFFVGGEGNVPAVYSGLQWLLAGWLAAQCAGLSAASGSRSPRLDRFTWTVTAAVCTYLALDEMLMFHETITRGAFGAGVLPTGAHNITDIAGFQVRPWTLIFVPMALAVGGALAVGFYRMLPRGSGLFTVLVTAGAVFIAGAAGVENVQAHQLTTGTFERQETRYYVNLLLEEGMEMIGVSLAVYVFAAVYFEGRARRLKDQVSTKAR